MNTFQMIQAALTGAGGVLVLLYFIFRIRMIRRLLGSAHSLSDYYIGFSDKGLIDRMRKRAEGEPETEAHIRRFILARRVFILGVMVIVFTIYALYLIADAK